jgi:hypothetical protein
MTSMLDRIRSRQPVPERDFDWLGTIGSLRYGRRKNQEYAVDRRPSDPTSFTPEDGEIAVARRHVERFDDGGEIVSTVTTRAWPVEPGTYDRLAKSRKPAAADRPMRTWDRLAALPVMQRREPLRMVTGPATSALDALPALGADKAADVERVAELAHARSTRSLIEVGGNEPPDRSVAGLVAFVERHGVELSLARGRLVARSRTPIRADLRDLIDQAKELIVGHLAGKPVICSSCASPAVTIAAIDAPMCAGCAE